MDKKHQADIDKIYNHIATYIKRGIIKSVELEGNDYPHRNKWESIIWEYSNNARYINLPKIKPAIERIYIKMIEPYRPKELVLVTKFTDTKIEKEQEQRKNESSIWKKSKIAKQSPELVNKFIIFSKKSSFGKRKNFILNSEIKYLRSL
jgi:hypothetical protein